MVHRAKLFLFVVMVKVKAINCCRPVKLGSLRLRNKATVNFHLLKGKRRFCQLLLLLAGLDREVGRAESRDWQGGTSLLHLHALAAVQTPVFCRSSQRPSASWRSQQTFRGPPSDDLACLLLSLESPLSPGRRGRRDKGEGDG